jgi:hypothetical protein
VCHPTCHPKPLRRPFSEGADSPWRSYCSIVRDRDPQGLRRPDLVKVGVPGSNPVVRPKNRVRHPLSGRAFLVLTLTSDSAYERRVRLTLQVVARRCIEGRVERCEVHRVLAAEAPVEVVVPELHRERQPSGVALDRRSAGAGDRVLG